MARAHHTIEARFAIPHGMARAAFRRTQKKKKHSRIEWAIEQSAVNKYLKTNTRKFYLNNKVAHTQSHAYKRKETNAL